MLQHPLTISGGWEEVAKLRKEFHSLFSSSTFQQQEPPSKSGALHFRLPTTMRSNKHYFVCESGTPLLLHSRKEKSLLAKPEEAIDLRQACGIFVLNTTNRFVIQAPSLRSKNAMEHLEFDAPSHDEAKSWVSILKARKLWFASKTMLAESDDDDEAFFSASEEEDEDLNNDDRLQLEREFQEKIHFLATVQPSLPMDLGMMDASPPIDDVPIRGYNYLVDSIKVKAKRMLMQLVAVDCFTTPRNEQRRDHISAHPKSRMHMAKLQGKLPPFTWVVVVQIPGSSCNYSVAMYLCPTSLAVSRIFSPEQQQIVVDCNKLGIPPKLPELLRKFFFDPNADVFRNERFKLIPTMRQAPWVVMSATPQKPAKLGQKLTQRYFLQPEYMELDLDVGSSVIADRVTRLSVGYSTRIVVQLSLVIEGQDSDELPEEVMASMSYVHIDLLKCSIPL